MRMTAVRSRWLMQVFVRMLLSPQVTTPDMRRTKRSLWGAAQRRRSCQIRHSECVSIRVPAPARRNAPTNVRGHERRPAVFLDHPSTTCLTSKVAHSSLVHDRSRAHGRSGSSVCGGVALTGGRPSHIQSRPTQSRSNPSFVMKKHSSDDRVGASSSRPAVRRSPHAFSMGRTPVTP